MSTKGNLLTDSAKHSLQKLAYVDKGIIISLIILKCHHIQIDNLDIPCIRWVALSPTLLMARGASCSYFHTREAITHLSNFADKHGRNRSGGPYPPTIAIRWTRQLLKFHNASRGTETSLTEFDEVRLQRF